MQPQKLLALDFDGVICDSRLETFMVSLRTYGHLSPQTGFASHPALKGSLRKSFLTTLDSDPVYREFQRLAPFGNRAEDFGVTLKAIEQKVKVSSQTDYDQFYGTCDKAWRDGFHAHLYQQRDAIRTAHPVGWADWHNLYQPLINSLRQHRADWVYAIATAKDRRSVDFLLNHWQIVDLFRPELIADKETGTQKTAHLTYLRELTGVDFDAITFMDDKVNHLLKVAPMGVRCILAAWGTDSRDESDKAIESGLPVAQLTNLDRVIFND